jgi:hypothetical protein
VASVCDPGAVIDGDLYRGGLQTCGARILARSDAGLDRELDFAWVQLGFLLGISPSCCFGPDSS